MVKSKWSLHSVAQFIGATVELARDASTYVPAAIAAQDWVAQAECQKMATATLTSMSTSTARG